MFTLIEFHDGTNDIGTMPSPQEPSTDMMPKLLVPGAKEPKQNYSQNIIGH